MFNAKTWKKGEKFAQRFFKDSGYKILDTNYRALSCEIDIIAFNDIKNQKRQLKTLLQNGKIDVETFKAMEKQLVDELVFVEVKSRTSNLFGEPEQAVTIKKQNNIKKVAMQYMIKNKFEECAMRFDVVSVVLGEKDYSIEHFENAF